jgi:hypothetical protein
MTRVENSTRASGPSIGSAMSGARGSDGSSSEDSHIFDNLGDDTESDVDVVDEDLHTKLNRCVSGPATEHLLSVRAASGCRQCACGGLNHWHYLCTCA